METVLSFNDLASLDQTTMGVGSAGLAVLARAGFFTVRGFVITPSVLLEFLKKEEVTRALAEYRASGQTGEDRERLRSVFNDERLLWSHEMDIVAGLRELGGAASLVATTHLGTDALPLYAGGEGELVAGVKGCWLRWIFSDGGELEGSLPSVMARKVLDAETSMELRRKKNEITVRAVFGLPEGLDDSSVTPDVYVFNAVGELASMEQKAQEWQYVLGRRGPVRIAVDEEFRSEEKASGEMLKSLEGIMDALLSAKKVARCVVCFVDDKPIIYSGDLIPEATKDMAMTIPHRDASLTLLPVSEVKRAQEIHAPVIATKLFLKVDAEADVNAVGDIYVEGLIITNTFTSNRGWPSRLVQLATEAKRRLNTSWITVELPDDDMDELVVFARSAQHLVEAGIEVALLLPGLRSREELRDTVALVNSHWKGPKIERWLPIKYPSNLFFMEALAENSETLALDLDTFARLMLGSTEAKDGWVDYSLSVLRNAYAEIFMSASALDRKLAVLTPELVSAPSLLEFLVREGAEVLCVSAEEFHTVKHIVASIEKRLLLEQGRS